MGERDRAKCWYCNGGLQNWEPTDQPWIEHAKWFPLCEYLLQQKGVEFVQQVVSQFQHLRRPNLTNEAWQVETNPIRSIIGRPQIPANQHGNPHISEAFPTIIDPREHIKNRNDWAEWLFNNNIEGAKDAIDLAKGLDFTKEKIIAALELIFDNMPAAEQTKDKVELSAADLINTIQDLEPSAISTSSASVNDTGNLHSAAGTLPHRPALTRTISQEYKTLIADRKCLICQDKPRDTVFTSCGHLAACSECAKTIKRCPVKDCKAMVKDPIKTFLS